ncbi:MAG: acyl-CoA dehydratase activase [Syntrophomonadaceae bacterium]|jgi:predicted CoA-substrate-specific enzyme activase
MIGMDLGSRSVKIVAMKGTQIINSHIIDTIDFYRNYANSAGDTLNIDTTRLGLPNDSLAVTGYGKITVKIAGAVQIPEIQAHAQGAVFQTGLNDFTLLDIGGQDTKIIKIRDAKVVDFLTNDRCAASSGRYMENMAAVLGISLKELFSYSTDPVELNSTCAVFGETEIIGKIVQGYSIASLAAGVNYALYKRFAPMLKQLHSENLVLAGGGALNQALGKIIEKEMGQVVMTLPQPQLNGALGCCINTRYK